MLTETSNSSPQHSPASGAEIVKTKASEGIIVIMALPSSSALKSRMHTLYCYTITSLWVFTVLLTGWDKGGEAALSTDEDS